MEESGKHICSLRHDAIKRRLIQSFLSLIVAYILSHFLAGFLVTFFCFYNGFHPEWKKPWESILARLIFFAEVCGLLWSTQDIWAYYLPDSWEFHLPDALNPSSISHQRQGKDTPDVPAQAAETPSSNSTQQASANPADNEKTRERLQNAGTSSYTSIQKVSAISADTASKREGLQAAGTPSTSTQNAFANPTDTGSTREGLLAERAGAVERSRMMTHSHEESPRDLVKDFSQTRNRLEEESPTIEVSFPDQDTHDWGSAKISDPLPSPTAHNQEEFPGTLLQDFSQKDSQPKEGSPIIQSPFLGQSIHDREGSTTSNPLPGSMLAQSQEKSRTIQGSFSGQVTHDRGIATAPDPLPCLALTHSQGKSLRDLNPKFDPKENQLEEFPAIQDSIPSQATHDQGGATTPDSLPGQHELPSPPSPESDLLTFPPFQD